MSRRAVFVPMILLLALCVTACEAGTRKTPKAVSDWSRGEQVAVSAVNQPLSVIAADDQIHILMVAEEANALHYVRLGASGEIMVSQDLDVGGAHPSDVQLLLSLDGSLLALWSDNPDIPRALFMVSFDRDGQLLSSPTQVSIEGESVAGFAVARNLDGSHEVFWATEIPTEGGIYRLGLTVDGQTSSANRLLIENGSDPSLQVDADGMIHLAWVEEERLGLQDIYYAVFNPLTSTLSPKTRAGSYRSSTGLVAYPPVVGLDEKMVYLFWSLERRGGGLTGAGTAETFFVSFPLDQAAYQEPRQVTIPSSARPEYASASGRLPYQELASAKAGWPTSLLYMPSSLSGQEDELGVYLVAEVATRTQSDREVVWAIFSDGEFKGYQLPTKVGSALRPTGVIDSSGNVHLCWLRTAGFGRYEVYYASTSETVKASLDRVTIQDRAAAFLDTAWALAPALGFFPPVLLLWSFASLAWVVIFYFVRTEGGLDRRPAQVAFVVSILLYLFSKLFLMPGVLFYAPLLDRLPESLQFVAVLGTPLFTLLAALGAVWIYFRRTPYRSLFAAWVIFVLTDSLLSLFIYVPRFLAG